jgi:hypothetical protein
MSLKEFLEDGNLTDFLKGGRIAISPSPTPSAPISPSAGPVKDLEVKTKKIIEAATKHLDETITTKIKDAGQKLNETITQNVQIKIDEAAATLEDYASFYDTQHDNLEKYLVELVEKVKEDSYDVLKSHNKEIILNYFNLSEENITQNYLRWIHNGMNPKIYYMPGFYTGESVPKFNIEIQFYAPYYTDERRELIKTFVLEKGDITKYSSSFFRLMAEMILLCHLFFNSNKINILKEIGIDDFESWLSQINPNDFIDDPDLKSDSGQADITYNVTAKASKFLKFDTERKTPKTLSTEQINQIFPDKIKKQNTTSRGLFGLGFGGL